MVTLWNWLKVLLCVCVCVCVSKVDHRIQICFIQVSLSLPLIEPYSQRDVRTHIQRLKDLLSTNPLQQAMSCSGGLSLSFLATITITDPEGVY